MIVGLGCVLLPLGLIETAYGSRVWCVFLPSGLIETPYESKVWLRLSAFRPY